MCLMSAQVSALLFETMNSLSGSLSLPENNVLRNKAAQFLSVVMAEWTMQAPLTPHTHHQCDVCASYLIADIPTSLCFFFFSFPEASCLARRRSAWPWQKWPPCFPRWGDSSQVVQQPPRPQRPLTRPIRGHCCLYKGSQQKSKIMICLCQGGPTWLHYWGLWLLIITSLCFIVARTHTRRTMKDGGWYL